MAEGESGRSVRNSMVEALWSDCDTRAKALGDVPMSARGKYIEEMAEQFQVRPPGREGALHVWQAAVFVYDEGLLGDDMQLANALWRRFFLSMMEVCCRSCRILVMAGPQDEAGKEPDPEQLELLVSYVRRVSSYLAGTSATDLIVSNKIVWPKLVV
jgi:hypothetical protein